jgi:GNAT superfamily N-acetyltransferase
MPTISVEDYRSTPALDAELAELGYAAIHGWPDQSPVDASLARTMLRPAGMTATTLALHRDESGRLLAGAAVRWPATLDAAGRLWGPVVHPDARRHGLGRGLMQTVAEVLAAHPGMLVSTTDIPESRTEGWSLFVSAGWDSAGVSELYQRELELDPPVPGTVPVRPAKLGEYLGQKLADLCTACQPELSPTTARDTYELWKQDSRYTPDGLLLAERDDRLIGAAIVYPSPSEPAGEPAEALLAELLVLPDLADAAAVRRALVEGALRAGAAAGATVARSTVDSPEFAQALTDSGFRLVDRVRRFTCRGTRP